MDTEPSRVPEGVYARIPLGQLTLAEAYEQVEDPSFWDDTMAPILFHYSVSDYWSLRVVEHRRLWEWLVTQRLADGDA